MLCAPGTSPASTRMACSASSSAKSCVCRRASGTRPDSIRMVISRLRPILTSSGHPLQLHAAMSLAPLALRRNPLEALACLAEESGVFLLEVPDPEHPATLVQGCHPVEELRIEDDHRDALAAIGRFVAQAPRNDTALPFPLAGGVVTCLAYEFRVTFALRPIPHASVRPLAVLRRYDPLLAYDRRRAQWSLLTTDPAAARVPWLERLSAPAPAWYGPLGAAPLAAELVAERYRDEVAASSTTWPPATATR